MREKKRVAPATLPTLDGSSKQVAWVRDRIRADQVDAFNAVDLPEYLKTRIDGATDDEEEARRLALVRAEIEKRGEAAVLAELEEAAQEIAAKMFEETSCRVWIDGRFGPGVLHRSTTEALRRVATTGSAKPPKPAFDLPPLDLPELKLSRLSGTPRQVSWAEDLRRRAVRDLTEERAVETARDNVQAWRRWSGRRDAKKIREALPELEKAIAEVGGDDAAARILGREALLKAREYVEAWDDSRDWIDLKTEQKVGLNAYAAQKIAGTPKEAAAILRRYAADAKAQERTIHAMSPFWRDAVDAVKGKFKPIPAPFVETGKEKFKAALDELEKTKPKFAALRNTANAATLEDAAALLRKATGITADFSGFTVDDANEFINGVFDFFAEFGRVETVHQIRSAPDLNGRLGLFETDGDLGGFCRVSLLNKGWKEELKKGYENGGLISGRPRAIIQHELGTPSRLGTNATTRTVIQNLIVCMTKGAALKKQNCAKGANEVSKTKMNLLQNLSPNTSKPQQNTQGDFWGYLKPQLTTNYKRLYNDTSRIF